MVPDSEWREQFALITQIKGWLDEAGIPFWLRGGWALDFLLGRITRSHSDIDLVVWATDGERVQAVFEAGGLQFERHIGTQIDFQHAGETISIALLWGDLERPFVAGIPEWVWHSNALTYPVQTLRGLPCQVLSPHQLLEEKEGYEAGTGRPLRPKDKISISLLRQLLEA